MVQEEPFLELRACMQHIFVSYILLNYPYGDFLKKVSEIFLTGKFDMQNIIVSFKGQDTNAEVKGQHKFLG